MTVTHRDKSLQSSVARISTSSFCDRVTSHDDVTRCIPSPAAVVGTPTVVCAAVARRSCRLICRQLLSLITHLKFDRALFPCRSFCVGRTLGHRWFLRGWLRTNASTSECAVPVLILLARTCGIMICCRRALDVRWLKLVLFCCKLQRKKEFGFHTAHANSMNN